MAALAARVGDATRPLTGLGPGAWNASSITASSFPKKFREVHPPAIFPRGPWAHPRESSPLDRRRNRTPDEAVKPLVVAARRPQLPLVHCPAAKRMFCRVAHCKRLRALSPVCGSSTTRRLSLIVFPSARLNFVTWMRPVRPATLTIAPESLLSGIVGSTTRRAVHGRCNVRGNYCSQKKRKYSAARPSRPGNFASSRLHGPRGLT